MLLSRIFGDWISVLIFFVLASVGVTLPVKASEKKNVKAGEKITLLTGFTDLRGDYSVWLYLKNGTQKDTLIKCDGEEVECALSKMSEGKLDRENGSLTFGPLNVADSGVYVIQTTNGDNKFLEKDYEVTVSESKTSTGSQNSAHYQRAHLASILTAAACVVLLL